MVRLLLRVHFRLFDWGNARAERKPQDLCAKLRMLKGDGRTGRARRCGDVGRFGPVGDQYCGPARKLQALTGLQGCPRLWNVSVGPEPLRRVGAAYHGRRGGVARLLVNRVSHERQLDRLFNWCAETVGRARNLRYALQERQSLLSPGAECLPSWRWCR